MATQLAKKKGSYHIKPFSKSLAEHNLTLSRKKTTTLQVNTGFLCNQLCKHCHLEAGPKRTEIMSRQTMEEVVSFADKHSFQVGDITGGAPEMVPDIEYLVAELAKRIPRVMFRSNLTAIGGGAKKDLMHLLKKHKVVIVASLPATNPSQTDNQRGKGVLDKSVATLQELNRLGYGQEGSGLELDLVSNPSGAFLPADQDAIEEKFKRDLKRKWDIVFNNLFTFANVPLGRFKKWLEKSDNYDQYMQKLVSAFNPCTVDGLMCTNLISISWDGVLYDCDFNQAKHLFLGGVKQHISDEKTDFSPGTPIATGEHCYSCSAGSGFT